MYKNILVPVSFDDSRDSAGAIQIAKALAEKGAKITFLHVVEHIPPYVVSYLPEEFQRESRLAIAEQLNILAKSIPGAGSALVEGHSGRTILDYAEEHDIDCIVIASHRPGAADLLMGSTAARVVRHANCAVHVLR